MKTRNPVEGYFGTEFPAICNHCGVMVPDVARRCIFIIFLRFLEKTTLTAKFSQFGSESFYRDTDRLVVFKFREFWPTGNR